MTDTAEVQAGPEFTGMKPPAYPEMGTSWQPSPADAVRYWHGSGWYLSPPEGFPAVEAIKPAETGAREPDDWGNSPAPESAAETADAIDGPLPADDANSAEPVAETAGDDAPDAAAVDTTAGNSESVAGEEPAPKKRGRPRKMAREPETAEQDQGSEADLADTESGATLATEAMERAADEFELNPKTLVEDARDFMLQQIKMRPKPWSATPEEEQRDVAAACEHAATQLVRNVIEAAAAGGGDPIRCLLESYTEKDGIKVSLKVKTFSDEEGLAAIVGLHRARGKHVLITVASVDDYKGGRDAQTDADQPDLEFEAGDFDDDDGGEAEG